MTQPRRQRPVFRFPRGPRDRQFSRLLVLRIRIELLRPPAPRDLLALLLVAVAPVLELARALEQRPQEAVQEDRAGRGGGAVPRGCEVQGGGGRGGFGGGASAASLYFA